MDAKPAPAVTTPAPAKPATTGAATAPQVAKTNLNTATSAELDKLPQIGPVRSKAIIEARAKAKFKNWDDFVARKVGRDGVLCRLVEQVAQRINAGGQHDQPRSRAQGR